MAFDGKHTDPIATNREVIALCATLREEGRAATPQEQVLLARYTGWGALGRVFDEARTDLEPQREALLAAVGEAGFAEMRASILTSYFTPPTVAGALWSGLVRMGFQGGRIVDPAAGSGALIAEAPPEIANRLQWLAIERCPVTCGVLRSRFPAARVVEMPFEGVPVQYGSCDAMVVNPPFDDGMVADEFDKHLTASAHNFFLMKGLRTLRVGGLAAVVVSRYFMDGVDSSVRENISKTARLVAAFRLPAGAFSSAGTEVVTDVLFFQRTAHDTERNPTAWVESVEWQSGIRISKWFLDHPEWMLGEAQVRPDAYGKDAFHLAGRGGDWPNMLMRLVGALPVGIYRDAMTAGNSDAAEPDIEVDDGDRTPVFGLALDSQGCPVRRLQNRLDAKAWQREPMPDAKVRRLAAVLPVRDAVQSLIRAETSDADPAQIEVRRLRLNSLYDSCVRRFGAMHGHGNKFMASDPSFPLVLGLELNFDGGISKAVAARDSVPARAPSWKRADILDRRVCFSPTSPEYADSADEALRLSLFAHGRVDLPYMAQITGMTRQDLVEESAKNRGVG